MTWTRRHEWHVPVTGPGAICPNCGVRRVRIKGHWIYRRTQLDLLTTDKPAKGRGTKPKKKTGKSVPPLKVTKVSGNVDLVECPPCEGSWRSCIHLALHPRASR